MIHSSLPMKAISFLPRWIDREDPGSGDLYISSRRKDGTWTEAKNLGIAFNRNGYDFCPMASPDGKYFFFTRKGDIYWVSMEVIKKLF